MSTVPLSPPSTGGDDKSRDNNSSPAAPPTPPSLDSLSVSSSSVRKGPVKLTARSCLYETCAASHWKAPVFDCCNQQGPSHHRSFTYKVSVEIKEGSTATVVDCVGKPLLNKKSAADSAAEGILWYLTHLGYPKKPARSKKFR